MARAHVRSWTIFALAVSVPLLALACMPDNGGQPGDETDGEGGAGGKRTGGAGGSNARGGAGGGNASGGKGGTTAPMAGASGSGGAGGHHEPDAGGGPDAPDVATVPAAPKLSTDVLPITRMYCAKSGCHDPMKKEHGMDLSSAATLYPAWVNKTTADHCKRDAAVVRVTPAKPESSFVMTLITATLYCQEVKRMPPPPLAPLSAAHIETIRGWIAAGAKND